MSLTNDQITAKNFKEFYEAIRPYLNGSFPTAIANKFDKANMYSTDEQIVGRWIDGKPLYQKTYNVSESSRNNWIVIDSTFISDNYTIQDIRFKSTNFYTSNSNFGFKNAENDSTGLKVFYGSSYTGSWTDVLTIKYTKTTDTAMEIGSDTDYSTTEKIIGTWIDGKPLYQKTYNLTPTSPYYNMDVAHSLTGVNFVRAEGFMTNSSGTLWPITSNWINNSDGKTGNLSVGQLAVTDTAIRVRVNPAEFTPDTIVVTLQYTKTTD